MFSNSTITLKIKDLIYFFATVTTCIAAIWVIPPISQYIEQNFFTGKSYPDGMSYKGDLFDGQKHGQGKLFDKDKNLIYKGGFHFDQFHGDGVWYLPNGEKYEGNFLNGLQNGDGKLYWDTGDMWYDGDWYNGKRSGLGRQYLKSGKLLYYGSFKNDLFDGYGTQNLNGGRHVGQYIQGKQNGIGTFYRSDNSIEYKGEYQDGEKHGEGMLFDEQGDIIYQGIFINGQIASQSSKPPKTNQKNTKKTIKPPPVTTTPPPIKEETTDSDDGIGDVLLGILAAGLIDEAVNNNNPQYCTCGTCRGSKIIFDPYCNCNYGCPTCGGYGYLICNN